MRSLQCIDNAYFSNFVVDGELYRLLAPLTHKIYLKLIFGYSFRQIQFFQCLYINNSCKENTTHFSIKFKVRMK